MGWGQGWDKHWNLDALKSREYDDKWVCEEGRALELDIFCILKREQ